MTVQTNEKGRKGLPTCVKAIIVILILLAAVGGFLCWLL